MNNNIIIGIIFGIIFWILIYFILILYRDNCIYPKVIAICNEKQTKLKTLLPIIINKLKQYNIDYFICAGTLLGYERHNKKFIPWDDDIDLVIMNTNDIHHKIKQIKDELRDNFITEEFFGYKIKDQSGTFIDLFIFEEKDNIIKSIYTTCLLIWPNDYFKKNETFPLFQDEFENTIVNIPKEHKKYLKRLYGNYHDEKITHNHYLNLFDDLVLRYV
jgi:phosphorylcholine metabolism protein LicD